MIDLTTSPAGTYYIDFEIGEYANSNLNLKITGDQNIVLNIPDETATLKTYQLNIDGKNCNIGGYANGGIGEKAYETPGRNRVPDQFYYGERCCESLLGEREDKD